MLNAEGYRFEHLVYEDDFIWICYAYAEQLERMVLWKMVKEGPRAMVENAKLIHEYETLALLQMDGVLKPHTLLRQGSSMVLLFDLISGVALRPFMAEKPLAAHVFLPLAIHTVEIVEKLHQQGLLHMNLRPDTILVVPASLKVYLTGFSDALPFRQSNQATRLEGHPAYMAPERMSEGRQQLDGRSDLYALGVTFYEMLAGELPFQATEPLAWAHAHMAKQPPDLAARYGVQPELAALVARLLAKAPEERYANAGDLRQALISCSARIVKGEVTAKQEKEAAVRDEVQVIKSTPIRQSGLLPFSDSGYVQMLDLSAVYKASQIFGSMRSSTERVRQLFLLLLEQTGATHGCWVWHRQGQFAIELVATLEAEEQEWVYQAAQETVQDGEAGNMQAGTEASVQRSLQTSKRSLQTSMLACPEVLAAAAALQAPLCIADALADGRYRHTAYVQHKKVRSVLCCPIAIPHEDVQQQLLYLENQHLAQVFSTERLTMVGMVAMQLYYAMRLAALEKPLSQQRIPMPSASLRVPELPAVSEMSAVPNAPAVHGIPALAGDFATQLTAREQEVLELLAAGLTNKEIAASLLVTAETVKSHVGNLFSKLNVNRRTQAIELARRIGLLR